MFYERFLTLCERKRISPSAAATQAGFNKGTVSVWKKKHAEGVDVRPEKDIAEKICSFFNCSETWLLGIDEQEKKPTSEIGSERDYSDLELMDAVMRANEDQKEAIRLFLKMK
jgi:transcriptional regulator with XRE-family HTH domain